MVENPALDAKQEISKIRRLQYGRHLVPFLLQRHPIKGLHADQVVLLLSMLCQAGGALVTTIVKCMGSPTTPVYTTPAGSAWLA